MQTTTTLVSD
jgi:hypothetical protein